LVNKEWTREFTEGYRDRVYKPYGIGYVISARATGLNDETVRLLVDSGCNEVRIGIETGNEGLRNGLLRKNVSDKALKEAFKALRDAGLRSLGFIIIGLPDESVNTYFDTVDMIIKLKPNLIRANFLYPYKHTEIYDICVRRKLLKEDFDTIGSRDDCIPLNLPHLTDKDLFMFRFLFPWYINLAWHTEMEYYNAINDFVGYSIEELRAMLPEIKAKDRELSAGCTEPHYRYYSGNESYFELYDNIKNSVQN
jgi:radical SAM superfamily enzyme YgiQ (UPF0313 family)